MLAKRALKIRKTITYKTLLHLVTSIYEAQERMQGAATSANAATRNGSH